MDFSIQTVLESSPVAGVVVLLVVIVRAVGSHLELRLILRDTKPEQRESILRAWLRSRKSPPDKES